MSMRDAAHEILGLYLDSDMLKKRGGGKGGKLDDPLARRVGDVCARKLVQKNFYTPGLRRNLSRSRARRS